MTSTIDVTAPLVVTVAIALFVLLLLAGVLTLTMRRMDAVTAAMTAARNSRRFNAASEFIGPRESVTVEYDDDGLLLRLSNERIMVEFNGDDGPFVVWSEHGAHDVSR